MKKIIHLSDLHVGHKGLSSRFESMVGKMFTALTPADDYVVVITGDLVDDITKDTQLDAVRWRVSQLREHGFHVLIAPGNHDYGTGSLAREEEMDCFREAIYGTKNPDFPRVDVIGNIAFVGLDSMEGEMRKHQGRWADGEIGREQRRKLDSRLASDEVKACEFVVVYLHHHPLESRGVARKLFHGLDDDAKLRNVLRKHHIDALLFGHNHDCKSWPDNELGIKRAYDAGSSTGRDKKGGVGEHRVIDLSKPLDEDCDAKLLG